MLLLPSIAPSNKIKCCSGNCSVSGAHNSGSDGFEEIITSYEPVEASDVSFPDHSAWFVPASNTVSFAASSGDCDLLNSSTAWRTPIERFSYVGEFFTIPGMKSAIDAACDFVFFVQLERKRQPKSAAGSRENFINDFIMKTSLQQI